jgi:hypothetical protein
MRKNKSLCIYSVKGTSSFPVEITECAPGIFRKLREKFGVSHDIMLKAFSPCNNFQAIHNFDAGSGASGSFFLFTDNKAFVLKTLKPSEEKILFGDDDILTTYFEHMMGEEETLLSRFYGAIKMKLSMMQEPISFIIMDSIINEDYMQIERLYDLKGST